MPRGQMNIMQQRQQLPPPLKPPAATNSGSNNDVVELDDEIEDLGAVDPLAL